MVEVSRRWEAGRGPHSARLSTCQLLLPGLQWGKEQELKLTLVLVSPPGHEDLFSCCQRKNFKGAPYSFFAIHITAALVLFMTDGMTVSLPSSRETPAGGSKRKSQAPWFPKGLTSSAVDSNIYAKWGRLSAELFAAPWYYLFCPSPLSLFSLTLWLGASLVCSQGWATHIFLKGQSPGALGCLSR